LRYVLSVNRDGTIFPLPSCRSAGTTRGLISEDLRVGHPVFTMKMSSWLQTVARLVTRRDKRHLSLAQDHCSTRAWMRSRFLPTETDGVLAQREERTASG